MVFNERLTHGKLIKRHKRFLADIRLDDGTIITAHCTNSGSMKSCLEENAEVYLTFHNKPERKTQYTWEMIKINNNWVGVNTNNPNKLAFEFISNKKIKGLNQYRTIKKEVTWNDSRLDLYAENEHEKCFIEVKNVTLKEDNYAMFPDAVTKRGQKHLVALSKLKMRGFRAVMLYIIQRSDVNIFAPAKHIDPQYAHILKEVVAKGVEIFPLRVNVSPLEINFDKMLPYQL